MTYGEFSSLTALSKLDAVYRSTHIYLHEDDVCYYLGEYAQRKGWSHSGTNNLIWNFKKPMSKRGQQGWRYKGLAIQEAARVLNRCASPIWSKVSLVPMPTSKTESHPLYDNRLPQMLSHLAPVSDVDIWNGLRQDVDLEASSAMGTVRASVETLIGSMSIPEEASPPSRKILLVVDDVLTTGRHFRAAKSVIRARFPELDVRGLFLARCAFEPPDFQEIFGDPLF